MEFIKKNIKIIGLVGCAILIIANFLPFITVKADAAGVSNSESASLMNEEVRGVGILAIVIEVILALLVLKEKRKLALIPNILIIIFIVACRSTFSGESIDIGIASAEAGYGIGFYAMIIGCILCLAFSFIKGTGNNSKKEESK